MNPTTNEPVSPLEEVRRDGHGRVKVAICDIDGVLRGKYMHKDKFLSAAGKGFGFCNVVFGWDCADVCYDNVGYTGWHSGYPDALARIDLDTYRRVPWDGQVAFFLADFEDEKGAPLEVCPRQTLKRLVSKAAERGFLPRVGMEFEWFNFKETPESLAAKGFRVPDPLTPGMFGYSVVRASQNRPYFAALMDRLAEFRVPIEGLHTETGPGVYEAAIVAADAVEAADRAVLFKTGVKEIAHDFGILPSFMAKWHPDLPGCSGHVHQSLWNRVGDINLFHDKGHEHSMTSLFHSYLAGQMQLLPDVLALYAPTVNSYKRLVEGLWAPTSVAWGRDNRTAAFRVIPGSKSSTRLETRVPGADVNPYLAVAAALGTGLYGIDNALSLEAAAVTGSAYEAKDAVPLPRTLQEATERLDGSKPARAIFGDAFVDHFVATRRWEWRQFREAVTDWELKRYFEII